MGQSVFGGLARSLVAQGCGSLGLPLRHASGDQLQRSCVRSRCNLAGGLRGCFPAATAKRPGCPPPTRAGSVTGPLPDLGCEVFPPLGSQHCPTATPSITPHPGCPQECVIGGDDYIRLCNLVVFDQTTTVPPHLLEFELALDVFPEWKSWFDSDLQRLINYLAGTFEAVNAILMRDAGVRVKITHVQVWDIEEPLLPDADYLTRLVHTWNTLWPCFARTDGGSCVKRDGVLGIVYAGGMGGGTLGGRCATDAYGVALVAPIDDFTRASPGSPWYLDGPDPMHQLHTIAHETTHLLGVAHGNAICDWSGEPIYDCDQDWPNWDPGCCSPPCRQDAFCAPECPPTHQGTLQSFCPVCCPGSCEQCGPRPFWESLRLHPREARRIRTQLVNSPPGCTQVGEEIPDCSSAGIPDTDGDGLGDPCDNCPQVSNLRQQDSDGVVLNWCDHL
ncbi:MAG: hypothetical protein KatS3mg077_3194 [Candidatus Binatia bacterium]|nr:MAG: hypothetical protein KatS3mg077_3194 [Candidatus Binatia bacterium]